MGVAVKNHGMGGGRRADVGPLLQYSFPGSLDLWLVDMGGNPFHWKDYGGLPP